MFKFLLLIKRHQVEQKKEFESIERDFSYKIKIVDSEQNSIYIKYWYLESQISPLSVTLDLTYLMREFKSRVPHDKL